MKKPTKLKELDAGDIVRLVGRYGPDSNKDVIILFKDVNGYAKAAISVHDVRPFLTIYRDRDFEFVSRPGATFEDDAPPPEDPRTKAELLARIQELLEYNNKVHQRARDAEAASANSEVGKLYAQGMNEISLRTFEAAITELGGALDAVTEKVQAAKTICTNVQSFLGNGHNKVLQ